MISRALKEEYALKHAKAYAERDARLSSLYERLPELKRLCDARRALLLERGQAALTGADVSALERELARLDAARASLLAQNGLDETVFLPQFECPLCKDTGYVGEPVKTPCACLKRREAEARFSCANLGEDDRFEAFREDIYADEAQRKRTKKLRDICERYAEEFPASGAKGLLIYGESGLGKTFLLRCIARRVLERGYSAVDLTVYGLMQSVMSHIRAREDGEDYTASDLLIIDDLGSEPAYGGITVQTLFSILNERQNLNKPTLFATNLTPDQLVETYGERLSSRLFAPRLTACYQLTGTDLRTLRF